MIVLFYGKRLKSALIQVSASAAVLSERCFEYLDAPLVRVTAPDTPVPFAPEMEAFFRPNAEKVCRAARALVAY